MKKVLLLLTFTSAIYAETYKAPTLDKIHWKKVDKVKSSDGWTPEQGLVEKKPDSADSNNDKSIRGPSSGEENKPKFWDFKVVK